MQRASCFSRSWLARSSAKPPPCHHTQPACRWRRRTRRCWRRARASGRPFRYRRWARRRRRRRPRRFDAVQVEIGFNFGWILAVFCEQTSVVTRGRHAQAYALRLALTKVTAAQVECLFAYLKSTVLRFGFGIVRIGASFVVEVVYQHASNRIAWLPMIIVRDLGHPSPARRLAVPWQYHGSTMPILMAYW